MRVRRFVILVCSLASILFFQLASAAPGHLAPCSELDIIDGSPTTAFDDCEDCDWWEACADNLDTIKEQMNDYDHCELEDGSCDMVEFWPEFDCYFTETAGECEFTG